MQLDKKVAVVTGAGRGIGEEDPDTLIQAEDIADAAVFLATQKRTAHTMELRVSQGLATRTR